MVKKTIIFGASEWGSIAFFYYKDKCNIIGYVDNDKKLWGSQLNGLTIYSPQVLQEEITVIIASKRYEKEIMNQINTEYKMIHEIICFRIDEVFQKIHVEQISDPLKEELIIAFEGGLGNQMFQYVLYKYFEKKEKNVRADLSSYINFGVMPFQLEQVFPSIKLQEANLDKKEAYLRIRCISKDDANTIVYIEPDIWHLPLYNANKEILKYDNGYIQGYHQTYYYAQMVQDEIKNTFKFKKNEDRGLLYLTNLCKEKESISIHIRRGDYLDRKYKRVFGDICTIEYYMKSIQFLRGKFPDAFFVFFSNDIEWVKEHIQQDNAIYVTPQMFDTYVDWYDMYLMSVCKHNIIANSSFSWWGAWLNDNPGKVVIAPKRWINADNCYEDICPPQWVRI